MSHIETTSPEVAERYASVLLMCAQEEKALRTTLRDAQRLKSCLSEEKKGWDFLSSPMTRREEQKRVLERLGHDLRVDKVMFRFLRVVFRHHRLAALPLIMDSFLAKAKDLTGALEGVLETSTPLTPQMVKAFEKVAEQHLGKKVALDPTLNSSLLGGVVIRVGTFMIDASLKTQLKTLRKAMKG